MGLAEFLLARIAEDEAVARAAKHWHGGRKWTSSLDAQGSGWVSYDAGSPLLVTLDAVDETAAVLVGHVARWNPDRVLAECEARYEVASRLRAMEAGVLSRGGLDVAVSELRQVCQFLALPYADHPDYNPDWKP